MDLPRTHTAVDCRPAELVAVYMEIISMNTQSSASRVPHPEFRGTPRSTPRCQIENGG